MPEQSGAFSQNLDISKVNSHEFGWQLAVELTKPFVDQRNKNGLSKMIQLKGDLYLGQATHRSTAC